MKYFAFTALLFVAACSAQTESAEPEAAPDLPIEIEGLSDLDEEKAQEIVGSINPLENDLRGLEVAIRLHQGFLIKPEGAVFNLSVVDRSGETRLDEEFVLTETTNVDHASLRAAERDAFVIRTFKLDESDYQRMHASDRVLQDLKQATPGENSLTFNAGAYTCAHPELETPDEYRLALFVRTAPDVDFVSLLNGEMVATRDQSGPFAFAWEPCAF